MIDDDNLTIHFPTAFRSLFKYFYFMRIYAER